MEMEPRMPRQPGFDPGMFVGSVIVDDQMQVESGGRLAVDFLEKADKLLMPVARNTVSDDLAVEHTEGGEQRGRSVAFVVVRSVPKRPFSIGRPGCVRSSAWI